MLRLYPEYRIFIGESAAPSTDAPRATTRTFALKRLDLDYFGEA
jgi:hypothetical protein